MKFLFLGNGSYNNHGCEAITIGTLTILRSAFGQNVIAANGVSERRPVVEAQESRAAVSGVSSFSIYAEPSLAGRIASRVAKLSAGEVITSKKSIAPHLSDSRAMLALGGDNFSLEYGVPYNFLGWNALARDAGLPTFIWGASIGPFSRNPRFESQFRRHANKLTGIFVRETATLRYLEGLGLGDKLHLAADPAFAMEPVPPRIPFDVPDGAIGLNLSPLMADFVAGGSLEQWKLKAREIIVGVARHAKRPIVLVPHVNATSATVQCDPGWRSKNDFGFLSEVIADEALKGLDITLVDDQRTAPELKHIISRLWCFAGARTHATIAAFGSSVPCVSFAYSVKARGLNQDIFGSSDYCIPPHELNVERVVGALEQVGTRYDEICGNYADKIPALKQSALRAGQTLKALIAG